MIRFQVSKVYPEFDFEITGASYAGKPKDGTMMYITGKVAQLVDNLRGHKNCLCFLQKGVSVPEDIARENIFIRSDNPACEYAWFASQVAKEEQKENRKRNYTLTDGGYYIGENVHIGENAYIEPNVLIGHDVIIGKDAVLMAGCVIKHAQIGDDCLCSENTVVGDYSFTMAVDNDGNKIRIPAMGRVIVGSHVEIGSCSGIAMGVCGDTVLEDYVKLDALVHIGHEAYIHKNVEITAGVIISGFVEIQDRGFLGINSSVRNRVLLGEDALIGMGAVVTKNVERRVTVAGNPAKIFGN